MKRSTILLFLISGILILDQALKFWIKTTLTLNEVRKVWGNTFVLHFTENNGMAFGLEFGGDSGKIFLSLFRIIAVALIGWWLVWLTKNKASKLITVGVALIFAGALGNIIDSAFYGLIFSESTFHTPALFMPDGGGYAGFLRGRVVDMLHFHLFDIKLFGTTYEFFEPIFNVADSSITCGVILFIIGNWRQGKSNHGPQDAPVEEGAKEPLAPEKAFDEIFPEAPKGILAPESNAGAALPE